MINKELEMIFGDMWSLMRTNIQYRRRGKLLDHPIEAIPTHPTTPIEDNRLTNNKREYIIRYEFLVMDGARIKPQVGDVIIDGENEWEVKNESGQTCFRYCDVGEVMIRIYVQKI